VNALLIVDVSDIFRQARRGVDFRAYAFGGSALMNYYAFIGEVLGVNRERYQEECKRPALPLTHPLIFLGT
jgi:hypothetical protein